MADLPGRGLAQELMEKSREESRTTPMEAVIAAAQAGQLSDQATFRLIGHLWTLERMFYYIYGGWGQGLEMNDFPPAVKYLFSRQILDESTHEMLYLRDAGHPEACRGGAGLPPAPGGRNPVTKVRFDYAICNSCGLCREVCEEMAIRPKLLEPRHLYEVQAGKCTGCGECLEYCPAPGALVPYEAWTPN